MNNEQLQELLLLQTNITTIILAITAFILAGVALDVLLHLYKKYVKKEKNMRKTFNMDDDLMAKVKRVAKEKKTTQTQVIHQALTSYINGYDMVVSMSPLLKEMIEKIVKEI